MEGRAPKKPNLIYGAMFAILCYLAVALSSACVKIASDTVSTATIVFFQSSICFLINLPRALKKGLPGLKTKRPYLHLVRSLAGLLSFFALFYAIKFIPLANAVLLQNTAPLWIPFVIWVWCKKRVPNHLWWSLIIGFVGVALILKPGKELIDIYSSIALLAGLFLAISLLAIRRLTATEPMSRVVFYYFLLGSIVSFPFAIEDFPKAFQGYTFLWLAAVAVLFYVAQVFITLAFGHGKASTLSPFCYSAVIFSAILGKVIWNQTIDLFAIAGMILVMVGGIASVILERKYEKNLV